MSAPESALVVLVPAAEAVVAPFRARYDPSAALGVPAHLTLLYPFKPPDQITDPVIDGLRRLFAGFAAFDFILNALKRFPRVLYLLPEAAEPFRQLTSAIWQLHPEAPPYGGRHQDVVPHLSLADRADVATLERVEAEFMQGARGRLPIRARASSVTLLENLTGRWQTRLTLPLGPSSQARPGAISPQA